MDKEVLENHKRYLERINFYRNFGYDLEKERDFILDKSLPVVGKILEIGTGKGHFALSLAKRGFSFVSIDISEEEQRIAKLNLQYFGLEKQAIFRIENAEHLSFPDQSFDSICSVNVFHHLENPVAVLNEIVRLLRPGGKAFLSDFNEKGLEIINECHTREGRKHDYFKHRLEEAKKYFINKGFIVKEFQSEAQRVIVAGPRIGCQ
ncbi:MAG: class I SAM-dependent methyltransferase [Candidatus Omnitrophica bacterium]|nr:class I SAM-dependent methyltransferase [Candidatus Omnitrophota bacterium]MBU1869650.1 class I SAM-dependent methyltransferase [Candidatus Omnitrophota bacterium]